MGIARAVIGASFGDEGKGLMVDYLCRTEGAGIVVRYCGGANAGHTVVTPEGVRHVFHHFGSGTLCGVPTFLSQFFVLNPVQFFPELKALQDLGFRPLVYAHPQCLVTTFADMMINQAMEDARGAQRHGSTGIGVNETFVRSQMPHLKITMADLWNGVSLTKRLEEICGKYAAYRTGKPLRVTPEALGLFEKWCSKFAEVVRPLGIAQCKNIIFEGSQGLLLDQDNKEFFPHVTRTSTGMKNIRTLCAQAAIDKIEPYYVTRTYLTRHGAGRLPGEDLLMRFADDTNTPHDYQGVLRFAPLETHSLVKRIAADAATAPAHLVITHCDQAPPPRHIGAALYSHGPTAANVSKSP